MVACFNMISNKLQLFDFVFCSPEPYLGEGEAFLGEGCLYEEGVVVWVRGGEG